jgi:hypothetical protein
MDANACKANFAGRMMTRLEPQNRVARVTEGNAEVFSVSAAQGRADKISGCKLLIL